MFPKVKNVNAESPKKRSKLLFFSARFFLFPLQVCSWMVSSKRLSFFGARIDCLNKDWTRIEQELFMNCSRFVQKLMRRLMRQLMGINGETFLAGSAPKKNWERTQEKLGAHPVKICLPQILISLPQIFLSLPLVFLSLPIVFLSLPLIWRSLRKWRKT